MTDLVRQRCFNHSQREAVACCPECSRFFCRECVTEHDDRVMCASCIEGSGQEENVRKRPEGLLLLLKCAAGIVVLWLLFFFVGRSLLMLPTSFHDGALWRELGGERM